MDGNDNALIIPAQLLILRHYKYHSSFITHISRDQPVSRIFLVLGCVDLVSLEITAKALLHEANASINSSILLHFKNVWPTLDVPSDMEHASSIHSNR